MAHHGYDDDDFDIVDADGWNQYDPYAMRRAPQQPSIHMTQQMTTKVAPSYDGRTSFFAFEDAIDDWCDITELEPEKPGPAGWHVLGKWMALKLSHLPLEAAACQSPPLEVGCWCERA